MAIGGGMRAAVLAAALTVLLAVSALAQGTVPAQQWERLAERAETTLEDGEATDLALEQLRAEIAQYRENFLAAQSSGQARVDTLQAQIDALGPLPAEGAPPEAADIAARRAELNEQMQRLLAPRRAAEEAYNRADGIIREIDTTLRERQTEKVLELGPTPLNPVYWPPAIAALGESFARASSEIVNGLGTPGQRGELISNLPGVALFLSIALALLIRGRYWMEWLTLRLYTGQRGRGSPAIAFVVSLGQVIVPVLGMFALREALFASGVLGLRGQIFAETLPGLGFVFFTSTWLGARMFPRRDDISAPLEMPAERRRSGRFYVGLAGFLLCVNHLLVRLAAFDRYDDATIAVLSLPLILGVGLILLRLGQMLRDARLAGTEASDDPGYAERLIHLMGRVYVTFGIAGPVLAAIGYLTAARYMVFPASVSLALMAFLAVLRIAVRDFYALFTGKTQDEASAALTPVLIVFALSVASLPLFALIWGMRVTDLAEIWTRFQEGFSVGNSRISPSDFITFAVVFAIGFGLTRLLQGTLKSSVLPRTRLDVGGRNAITAGIGYLGILLAVLFAVTSAGIDLSSLAIVAGALSVGIGFGLQNIVSNFVSGIILLIERPISEGDWIEVGGQMGYVRDISVRSTRIETFDKTDVIVPNADFVSGTVTNWTRGNLVGRVIVPVSVAYGTDTRKVEKILQEIAEAQPLVVMNPPPAVLFIGFGADGMMFEIRAILRDVNFVLAVKSDVNHEIAARFRAAGIEIPFAQRDLWLRNPEALRAAASADREAAAPRRAAPDIEDTHAIANDRADETEAAGRDDGDSPEDPR
ncbi:DUF3772 domain-containing protein [Oceaniglobus roseus]|uniref:DUF3772 domain-containing protein n=1 Tax=Oceaniglobus roseus TaxID=1737570 RepID=UPI000C7F0392|nr:DUF3772 domain-containing protein [Kandeliimicrobium roseum]